MEETPAQEGVGQFLFVVRRNDDDRSFACLHPFTGFVHIEAHAIEFLQQVVRKLDVRLVDLVDQQNGKLLRRESLPKLALFDVVRDVVDTLIAKLAVAKPRHGIVLVQTLLRLRGRLDVPFDQGRADGARNFVRQHGLPGSRFAFDQQRPPKRHRRVHRDLEVLRRDIGLRAFETLRHEKSCRCRLRCCLRGVGWRGKA